MCTKEYFLINIFNRNTESSIESTTNTDDARDDDYTAYEYCRNPHVLYNRRLGFLSEKVEYVLPFRQSVNRSIGQSLSLALHKQNLYLYSTKIEVFKNTNQQTKVNRRFRQKDVKVLFPRFNFLFF